MMSVAALRQRCAESGRDAIFSIDSRSFALPIPAWQGAVRDITLTKHSLWPQMTDSSGCAFPLSEKVREDGGNLQRQ